MKAENVKEKNIDATLPTELHNDVKRVSIKQERQPSSSLSSPTEETPMRETTSLDCNNVSQSSLGDGDEQDPAHLDRNIRRIIELRDPDILEAGTARAMQILKKLKKTFVHHDNSGLDRELASWIDAIAALIQQAQRKRTVVGVVGNTGAGKSSIINAVLNEERLVPTNCMRACTAVVTEISWNNSNEASSKYRAEIEFISPEDWEKELSVLMQEISSENGKLSREAQDPNSDAGVAWAKFHAVYPFVAKDALHKSTIPTLMSTNSILSVLGTTKHIHMSNPGRFYVELQKYVDSKERVSTKDKSKSKPRNSPAKIEYWPLIKVVKIYTKSSALSTGAVIVNLPGVQDSNAARADVANSYMKQCTGLWIVAPINRAVDDKAAKTLLGDSFKRQLKYDGGFSSVTFICSKTDDISITEVIESLDLDEEVAGFEQQSRNYDKQIEQAERKIEELRESQEVYRLVLNDATKDIETWMVLQTRLEDGKLVYAPITEPKKRKKASSNKLPLKKQSFSQKPNDRILSSSDGHSSSDDEGQIQTERVVLSELDIKNKLKELEDTKKNAQCEYTKMQRAIDDLRSQVRISQEEQERIRAEVSRICIAERNLYSKSAIQQDFAAGIKDIDQENAAEADEDSFDPDEEIRDYDQVAKSLPVFCVSSRAYQKMCGRMQKDDNVHGFTTKEETEIPQLQTHCQKLTEAGRIQTSRNFLTGFCQLLISLSLWTSDNTLILLLDENEKQRHLQFLEERLEELETGFDEIVHACIEEVRSEVRLKISDRFPELINTAIEAAPTTAFVWGQKDLGGLLWASYKAVVRRDGVFQSPAAGKRDFNSDLIEPILKRLATGWERTFHTRLPEVFSSHFDNLSKLVDKAHNAIEVRAHSTGIELASIPILKTRVPICEENLKSHCTELVDTVKALQGDANRNFAPCIMDMMRAAYYTCAAERGPGSFKRMKGYMTDHVELTRHTMFSKAVQKVEDDLEAMCKTLQELMEDKVGRIFNDLSEDYTRALGDQRTRVVTKEERKVRSATRQILKSIDAQFERIANGDLSLVDAATPTNTRGNESIHEGAEEHDSMEDSEEESSGDSEQESSEEAGEETHIVRKSLWKKFMPYNQPYVEGDMDDDE